MEHPESSISASAVPYVYEPPVYTPDIIRFTPTPETDALHANLQYEYECRLRQWRISNPTLEYDTTINNIKGD